MKLTFVFASLLIASSAPAAVFEEHFDSPDAAKRWHGVSSPSCQLEAQTLRVEAKGSTRNVSAQIELPLEALRGARVQIEARVKAEGVTQPPKSWNGIKVMLHTKSPSGDKWEQQNNLSGTFDWKRVGFTSRVAKDATLASLVLGLEQVSGVAWFDDVKVTITSPPKTVATAKPNGTVFKGHDEPRLRGAMIGANVTAEDLEVLGGQWGANHVRWQLIWGGFPSSPADKGDLKAYDAWLESALHHLDDLLPVCERLGIKVLIDMHTPPGGRNDAHECQLFHDKRFQDSFIVWWEKIAAKYRGNKTVWGYDLVNEPVEGLVSDGVLPWNELAAVTAKRVRAVDPDHAIILEPEPWGGPDAMENLVPVDVPGVVYSAHMYLPHQFTHQGVNGQAVGFSYPGEINGKQWDKDQLRLAMKPVIDFQHDYGVHIYIGEFSAIRWAPDDSAERYLRDVIEIFEEQGWDWAYHAFREWNGWSVEHSGDPKDNARSTTPTSREKLLREWFAKNRLKR